MIRARVTLKKDNVLLLEILEVPEESFIFEHEGFYLKAGSFTQIEGLSIFLPQLSIFLPHPDEEDENKWRTFVDFKNNRATAHMWLDKIVKTLRAYNDQFDF